MPYKRKSIRKQKQKKRVKQTKQRKRSKKVKQRLNKGGGTLVTNVSINSGAGYLFKANLFNERHHKQGTSSKSSNPNCIARCIDQKCKSIKGLFFTTEYNNTDNNIDCSLEVEGIDNICCKYKKK